MRNIFFLPGAILFINYYVFAQNQQWKVFTNEDLGIPLSTETYRSQISFIAEDLNSIIWVGTDDYGLLKYDDESWTRFDTTNSPLPVNRIWTIEIDGSNNKWIGTYGLKGGLALYNDTNWTAWELSDYGIENTSIFDIEIDTLGNLWMGTYWEGLAKFDGTNFFLYNSLNSNLDPNMEEINCLDIDASGNIWCGSDFSGAAMFDGYSEWTMFYTYNNNIDDYIYSLEIDNENNVWFGGVDFISKYDNNANWTVYDYSDVGPWYTQMIHDSSHVVWFSADGKGLLKLDYSVDEEWTYLYPPGYDELLDEGSWALTRDSKGNFWVGYNNGYIGVYNPDGLNGITNIESSAESIPNYFYLSQNYPNPFNPTTNLGYTIQHAASIKLIVYDLLGREVEILVNKHQSPGNYQVTFDASDLPSGTYFYSLYAGRYTETKKMTLLR